MLQMDGVSALDCQSVCTIAEHQTGNSMYLHVSETARMTASAWIQLEAYRT